MMLFDLVRSLNDEMGMMMRKGMPGATIPVVLGLTDGYNAQLTFMDKVVWCSTTWQYESNPDNPTEEQVEAEMRRIEKHVKNAIMDHMMPLFNIQW